MTTEFTNIIRHSFALSEIFNKISTSKQYGLRALDLDCQNVVLGSAIFICHTHGPLLRFRMSIRGCPFRRFSRVPYDTDWTKQVKITKIETKGVHVSRQISSILCTLTKRKLLWAWEAKLSILA